MSVTIKQIAEISGISRGTVDRVLNGRGRVSAEKAEKVRLVAEQLGYRPNLAGKALAARKKKLVIGVVLPAQGNPFFDDVVRGIRQAETELSDYGVRVLIKSAKGYDGRQLLGLIDDLSPKVAALIATVPDRPAFAEKINGLADGGQSVVTLNTDVQNSRRVCYVGSDYFKGGEIACGLLGLLTGGTTNVAIFTGSTEVLGHNRRIEGFLSVMKQKYPGFSVAGIAETKDLDKIGYETAKKLLQEHPQTQSVFLAAAGSAGVLKAVREFTKGRKTPFYTVAFDLVPQTAEMLRQGAVQAVVSQQPFVQGYEAVKITFFYLVNKILPEGEKFIVKNEINIPESLED